MYTCIYVYTNVYTYVYIYIHICIYNTRTKVFPLDLADRGSADQLVCFKRILIYSDLKYDPPRRLREMRIIDPRRMMMMFIRH